MISLILDLFFSRIALQKQFLIGSLVKDRYQSVTQLLHLDVNLHLFQIYYLSLEYLFIRTRTLLEECFWNLLKYFLIHFTKTTKWEKESGKKRKLFLIYCNAKKTIIYKDLWYKLFLAQLICISPKFSNSLNIFILTSVLFQLY